MIREETESDIKTWIAGQDSKELLEHSLNSRLQFFLGALVCKFCEGVKVRCTEQITEFCQTSCDRFMKDLLPSNTESCVVAVATRLTVDKARAKCAIWWNTMAMSFVEREVQQIADINIKHVLSEVRTDQAEEHELRELSNRLGDILLVSNATEDCCLDDSRDNSCVDGRFERLLELGKKIVINKENTVLFQNIADATVDVVIEYIINPSKTIKCNQSRGQALKDCSENELVALRLETLEQCSIENRPVPQDKHTPVDLMGPVSQLLLLLRDLKGVEVPLTKVPPKVLPKLCEKSSGCRFKEICLKLVYIGVLSPPRLEHWLLWFLETSNLDSYGEVVSMATRIVEEYLELKANVLKGEIRCVPRVAYFVKQYIVSDFEILKRKLNSL